MAPFDLEKEICVCNSVTAEQLRHCIKTHQCSDVQAVITQCEVGDKCESCHEEGYENDGYSIAMVLSLVKQNRL